MRIATSFIHQQGLADIQRAQLDLFQAQQQAGSENKASDLRGYDRDARSLVSANSFAVRSDAFVRAGAEIANRLDAQDLALGQTVTAAEDTRLALTDALGLDRGDEVMARVGHAFSAALSGLDLNVAGKFVFGGVRDDASPMAVSQLSDMAALATADDAFVNAQKRVSVQLDERTNVDVAPLADDVARDLFASFKRIQDFEIANGPFAGPLTAAQRTFLETEIGQITTVVDGLNTTQAANGALQARAEAAGQRQADARDYFTIVAGDIEGVDLAEVATRLSQAQLQFQASAQIYASIKDTSLLNFL